MERKVRWLRNGCLVLLALLAVRLGYLQLVRGEDLSEEAARQRWVEVLEQSARGEITDRHFCSLTQAGEQWIAVVSPDQVQDGAALYRQLQPFCNWTAGEFLQKLSGERIFSVSLQEEPDFSQTAGLEVAATNQRYGPGSVAEHVLGYCSGSEGAAGLEAAYNEVLAEGGGISAGAVTNAAGQTISEFSMQEKPEKERSLRLTLDASFQNIIEQTGRDMIRCGAAVLLDVHSSDVLAMASFPNFDPSNVAEAVSSEDGAMVNRALCAYDAGSIFKIVVAAAALEEGLDPGWYNCTGSVTIGDSKVSCYNGIAHGQLSLPEAFGKSCNCYFIQLGRELGADKILDMADKFGIGTQYDLFENSGEQQDSAGERKQYYDGEIANLSIGQGQVMLTPLRGAELAAVVASGGMRHKVNLVDCITDGNQKILQQISSFQRERVLSKETAQTLQSMMYLTTASGTAKSMDLDSLGGAGCKTGTAQTGWGEGEDNKVHSWITGFFPAQNPRYALCVFVENGENEGVSASKVFERIAKQILKE